MTGLTAAEAALVRQAREASDDPFMRGQVEAFRRRRRAAFIARGEPVACAECDAVGASAGESFAIHHPELLPDGGAGQAQRRSGPYGYGYYDGGAAEISRAAGADGMGQMTGALRAQW